MAFVYDNQIKKIGGIVTKPGNEFPLLGLPGHEGLEDGEEQTAIFWHSAFQPHLNGINPDQGIFRKGGKGVVPLIREIVAVGEKQDTGSAGGGAFRVPIVEIPPTMEKFPGDLKGNEGLPGTRGQG